MLPAESAVDAAAKWSVIAIAAVTIGVLIAVNGKSRFARRTWITAAVFVTLIAGATPHVVAALVSWQSAREHQAEQASENAKAIEIIATRRQDVEARISTGRRYSPEESLAFVNAISDVDLTYRGLPDRSGEMQALLKRALEARILDPNIMVKGRRPVDVNFEPLFRHYYRTTVRPVPDNRISLRDWETLKLLVAGGADMSIAGAEAVAQDLRKAVVPDPSGRFFQLR